VTTFLNENLELPEFGAMGKISEVHEIRAVSVKGVSTPAPSQREGVEEVVPVSADIEVDIRITTERPSFLPFLSGMVKVGNRIAPPAPFLAESADQGPREEVIRRTVEVQFKPVFKNGKYANLSPVSAKLR
jgi:hypothetical protein